jgi:hypothetical protein
MLQTQSRFLTIVELISRQLQWDDSQQCTTRDYLNIEVPSDVPLTQAEINQSVKKYVANGYLVTGVSEIDYDAAADWF